MFDEAISLLSIWAYLYSWLTPTVLFVLLNLMIGTIAITSGFTSYKPHHQNHPDTTLHHHTNHYQQPPQPQLTRAPSLLQRLKSVNFYSYYSQNPPTSTLVHQQAPPQVHVTQQNTLPSTDPLPKRKPEHGLPKVPARVSFQTQTRIRTRTPLFDETVISQARAYAQAQPRTPTFDEEIITQTQVQTPEEIVTQAQNQTHLEEDIIDLEGPTLEEIYNKIKGSSSSVHYNRQNSDTKPVGGEIPVKLPAKIKKSASDKSAFNHFEAVEEAKNVAPPPAVEYIATVAAAVGPGGTEVDARADDFINRFKKQLQLQKMESIVRYKEMISRGSGK